VDRRTSVVLLLLLLGCGRSNETEGEPANPDPTPATEVQSATDPYRESVRRDLAPGSEGETPAPYLAAVRQAMASGPEAVLELYLAWDTAGYRFAQDGHALALDVMSCFRPEEGCINPEPGWDFAVVVRGYSWDPMFILPDSAAFVVSWDQVGQLPRYPTSRPFRSHPPDTVLIRRMENGWRLGGVIWPHVSLAQGLEFSRSAVDTALVRQWQGSGQAGGV
jgi:hypothetical protein